MLGFPSGCKNKKKRNLVYGCAFFCAGIKKFLIMMLFVVENLTFIA